MGNALTPGPSACSKRITFQHSFELGKAKPSKNPKKVNNPKPYQRKVKKTKVTPKTTKEKLEAIRDRDRARNLAGNPG